MHARARGANEQRVEHKSLMNSSDKRARFLFASIGHHTTNERLACALANFLQLLSADKFVRRLFTICGHTLAQRRITLRLANGTHGAHHNRFQFEF